MENKPAASPLTMKDSHKTWVWSVVVLALLAIIVVGATLMGVYMTQKHTEAVVEMAFSAKTGEKIQQTVMVNNKENVAAFYVNANNLSSTILYDYNHNFVGFRRMSGNKCYIMDMGTVNVPTMTDILRSIKYFQHQNTTNSNDLSYDLVEGKEADRTELGVPVNILCSDVPIYWATQNTNPHLRWKINITFELFGVKVSIKFQS